MPTTHAHINSLLQNVHAGLGVVRYRKDPLSAIKKMEDMLTDLMKAGDVSEAFTKLRELVKAGHLSPEHERILRRTFGSGICGACLSFASTHGARGRRK